MQGKSQKLSGMMESGHEIVVELVEVEGRPEGQKRFYNANEHPNRDDIESVSPLRQEHVVDGDVRNTDVCTMAKVREWADANGWTLKKNDE